LAGLLSLVATPIGNLEDITYRAVRVMGEADIVAAEDKRSAARLLNHYGVRAKKLVSMFEGNEAARAASLVEALEAGQHVCVISEAGTPAISDPGARLVRAAADAGIRVEVLPGASACVTAVVGSGLPVDRFLYIGFPPREPGARRALFGGLRTREASLVLYESPERLAATLADLADAFGGERRAVLGRELTKLHEEYVRGTLSSLAERYAEVAPRGECTLVVEGAEAGSMAPVDVEAEMRALLASGLGPKDAAARLVVTTGKPRRQLYQLALSLKREVAD
jgi:16S rRNA (cytidine1402-2'-O)-methyltransferase